MAMNALARSYMEVKNRIEAHHWTDTIYRSGRVHTAEPAYRLCRRLLEHRLNENA
jgi:hypothetical protein